MDPKTCGRTILQQLALLSFMPAYAGSDTAPDGHHNGPLIHGSHNVATRSERAHFVFAAAFALCLHRGGKESANIERRIGRGIEPLQDWTPSKSHA